MKINDLFYSQIFKELSNINIFEILVIDQAHYIFQNQSTTWLCLDGPLNPGWSDNFNSVLSEEKVCYTSHL